MTSQVKLSVGAPAIAAAVGLHIALVKRGLQALLQEHVGKGKGGDSAMLPSYEDDDLAAAISLHGHFLAALCRDISGCTAASNATSRSLSSVAAKRRSLKEALAAYTCLIQSRKFVQLKIWK